MRIRDWSSDVCSSDLRSGGAPVVEQLDMEDGRGFAALPPPDPADLFFDLEGDPLEEGGLDYLWGVHYRDQGKPVFRFRWGHDDVAERATFEDVRSEEHTSELH